MERSTPQLSISADGQPGPTGVRPFKRFGPWGGSAAVHGTVLLLLLVWTIPILQQGSLSLTAFTGSDDEQADELTFSLEDTSSKAPEQADEQPITPLDFTLADPILAEPSELRLDLEVSATTEANELATVPLPDQAAQPQISAGSVSDANTVEEAVDKITGGIRGHLEEGDVLVVWLLDSSLSLKDDRQRVAKRLETFLADIEATSTQRDHKLLNAVAAFGRKMSERVSPTTATPAVLHSIKTAPIDKSGIENVFKAVEDTVVRYRRQWKSQMMIVVWTDESGDDVQRLSKTIARCAQAKVAVSVVGPSAVLGADSGLHAYTDPKTKQLYQLPVKRGPDSPLPERIRLNYWFRGSIPGSIRPGNGQVGFPSWYGGADLAGLTSGFSPYALTRLATSTGGSYTIFDRPKDRAPFDFELMSRYLPSYGTLSNYEQELETHPLRQAIHDAVKATYASKIKTPDLMFFGQQSADPPHSLIPLYFTPAQFASKLRASRGKIERQARHFAAAIDVALSKVSSDGDAAQGMDYEYEQETSPRWRAWYDLTRGRLLANSVRVEEYRLTIASVLEKGFLNDDTNGLMLRPSKRMLSSSEFQQRAEEARDLLVRCLDENPDTPWAYLAQREVANGLGIKAQQMQFRPVEMKQRPPTKLPRF